MFKQVHKTFTSQKATVKANTSELPKNACDSIMVKEVIKSNS